MILTTPAQERYTRFSCPNPQCARFNHPGEGNITHRSWGYVRDTCLCRIGHKHVSRTNPCESTGERTHEYIPDPTQESRRYILHLRRFLFSMGYSFFCEDVLR